MAIEYKYKTCKSCRYCDLVYDSYGVRHDSLAKCNRPELNRNPVRNYIDGEILNKIPCETARRLESFCGQNARYHEYTFIDKIINFIFG